jgi:hypothetical protein
MKIDGVTMPVMNLKVGWDDIENEQITEAGTSFVEVIRASKRVLNFSSSGMSCAQMATLLTAILRKAEVVITEFHDPELNANGTGTFRPRTPTSDQIRRRDGTVIGYENIQFTAKEV